MASANFPLRFSIFDRSASLKAMNRIAIISDVHGNLPALNAVLKDLDERQPDTIFCLGDLVDFAPWPNEVIEAIRHRRIPTLMGNHNERIAFQHKIVPPENTLRRKEPRGCLPLNIDAMSFRQKIAPT